MSEEKKARKIRMNDSEWEFFKEFLGPEWLRIQINNQMDSSPKDISGENAGFALRCASSISEKLLKSSTVEDIDAVLDASAKLSAAFPSLFYVSYCISQTAILNMKLLLQEQDGGDEGVYVIQYESGIIKIGRTRFFENRLMQIRNFSSEEITCHSFFPCKNSSLIEASMHSDLSSSRIKNEFFQYEYEKAVDLVISKISA